METPWSVFSEQNRVWLVSFQRAPTGRRLALGCWPRRPAASTSNPASGTERALERVITRTRYPDDAQHAAKPGEFARLWAVWEDWIATGRPLLGWQFQLRALTAQRGGEVLQMRFSDLREQDTHWIKPFAIRKRKKTAVHQTPCLIPRFGRTMSRSWRGRMQHTGGTWNGKKWGWPRAAISDFVFPSRTDPEAPARNFWAEEVKELSRQAKVDDFRPHDLRRWASTQLTRWWVIPSGSNATSIMRSAVWPAHNLDDYARQKTYVAYTIENRVRERPSA